MFTVPASKASIKQNRFEFKLPGDDTTYSLPKLQFVKPKLVLQISGSSKADVVRLLMDHYIPDAFEQIESLEQLTALYEAWADASGITPGESSASTDS
ncbi:hypothetical protein [Rathayibacter sp. VKM Ac-2927]|uniref:hypothetical protein n=1 Tax=Rathayibacter sp. VKM Ac-2927 TaxID=2929478 RepID=UPI001FB2DD85|nr:hypothetical protein [Rathayibacter sp. VKM Ac-2927]MCJ1687786.1 hypothetical protein [Rathayibacter sp. VKM Ac-2927]